MNGNDPAGIHDIKTFGRPGTGAQNEFTDKTWTAGASPPPPPPPPPLFPYNPNAFTHLGARPPPNGQDRAKRHVRGPTSPRAEHSSSGNVLAAAERGDPYSDELRFCAGKNRRSSDPEFLRPDSLLIWVYPVGGRKNEFLGWEIVTELGLKLNAACVAAERNRDGGEGNEDSCVVGGGEGSGSESGSGVMDGYSVSGSSVGVAVAGVSP
ncbi:hypothetical protein MMC21_008444 [Puttea exsequens]|nr:hypothetical protein [Puttea exsequens]